MEHGPDGLNSHRHNIAKTKMRQSKCIEKAITATTPLTGSSGACRCHKQHSARIKKTRSLFIFIASNHRFICGFNNAIDTWFGSFVEAYLRLRFIIRNEHLVFFFVFSSFQSIWIISRRFSPLFTHHGSVLHLVWVSYLKRQWLSWILLVYFPIQRTINENYTRNCLICSELAYFAPISSVELLRFRRFSCALRESSTVLSKITICLVKLTVFAVKSNRGSVWSTNRFLLLL